MITQPFIERLVLRLLDGVTLNLELRILVFHHIEIVGGARALLAAGLLKIGHVDRLGRANRLRRRRRRARDQILPGWDVDPALGQVLVDETWQLCFDLLHAHQQAIIDEYLGHAGHRLPVKQRLVEFSQRRGILLYRQVYRIDLQPRIVPLGQ